MGEGQEPAQLLSGKMEAVVNNLSTYFLALVYREYLAHTHVLYRYLSPPDFFALMALITDINQLGCEPVF